MTPYQEIAYYYDMLMNASYYDHDTLGKTVHSLIGEREQLLELGIGTGLLAQSLLKTNASYEITGIDFSQAMLEIAEKRLANKVQLVECDIAEMALDRKFEAAVSSGGTWVIVRSESSDELCLGTHLFDHEKDLQGLKNVSEHLEVGGLLLLSVHLPHEDRDIELTDGIVYSQKIKENDTLSDHFSINKTYTFKRGEELLSEESFDLGFYKDSLFPSMFAEAGFEPVGMTESKEFFIYKKVA